MDVRLSAVCPRARYERVDDMDALHNQLQPTSQPRSGLFFGLDLRGDTADESPERVSELVGFLLHDLGRVSEALDDAPTTTRRLESVLY
jgi:hypothetical protein